MGKAREKRLKKLKKVRNIIRNNVSKKYKWVEVPQITVQGGQDVLHPKDLI